mgnify:FL=1
MTTADAEKPMKRWLRLTCIALVACAAGWMTMQMEILGGRMLTPYFGSAVYVVMGSVIGVFLLSLSVGYMVGGWISRRRDSQFILGGNLVATGAWLATLPLVTEPVCERIFQMGLSARWGSLLAAFILFCPPTVLLGTVSPTLVGWLTTRAEDSGLNAGVVMAVSTMASFVGCVVTAFYLVLLSVRVTIWASGGLLALLGGVILAHGYVKGRGTLSARVEKQVGVAAEPAEDEAV